MSATVIYVHGAGNKPPAPELKQAWDRDLFGRDMAQQTRMAHYADLLHARPGSIGADACTLEQAIAALITLADEEGEAFRWMLTRPTTGPGPKMPTCSPGCLPRVRSSPSA